LAVIYDKDEESRPSSFYNTVLDVERIPGIEVVHLALDERAGNLFSQLSRAISKAGAPLLLAAAGGSIGPIAVLYPDIGEPYRSIFAKIIEGIEDKTTSKVTSYAVGNSFNAREVSSELKRQDIRVVIALGRNGLKAANSLDKEIGIVAGGVVNAPGTDTRGGTILSLAPDPALLFSHLKAISPKTQRVFVVYDPEQNGWLIKRAREAALAQGIELIAHEASDLKTAMSLYQAIFSSIDVKRDALWLPQDSATVDESTVLPLVLQESWEKGLLFFSSTVSHVKRGALFSLFPNNRELGRNLAASALGATSGTGASREIVPLREVLTAVNTRTASHLGLQLSSRQQDFDLVFPEH